MPSAPRILIVKTSSLGDVIHGLPVVSDIQRAMPDAIIDWVAEDNFADIPALHPGVRRVIRSSLRRWRRAPFAATTRTGLAAFRRDLQLADYDYVIDLQGLIKSAWIARQAIGPRAGFDRHSAREGLASWFYQRRYPIARDQHAVLRNRQLAAAALDYSLAPLSLDYGIATPGLQKIQSNATTATLITATSRDDKLWHEQDWIALGTALQQQGIASMLPAGNPIERNRAERIAAEIPHARILPPMSVAELATAFSTARLAVGVDTGLTHLACALNIPTLAIYTATDPGLTGVIGRAFFRNLGGRSGPPSLAEVLAATVPALG